VIIIDKALRAREEQGKPIRVAMIGAGFMGQGLANQIENSTVGMRMVAVYNRHPERALHVFRYAGREDVILAGTQTVVDDSIRRGVPVAAEDPFTICRSPEVDVVVDVTGSVEFGTQIIL
jgi:predicted homoserine dehydrogenase-like protein